MMGFAPQLQLLRNFAGLVALGIEGRGVAKLLWRGPILRDKGNAHEQCLAILD